MFFEPEEGVHKCNQLSDENENRASQGESPVYIFLDGDNKTWNLRVGLEFVRIRCCPYCFEKLKEKEDAA